MCERSHSETIPKSSETTEKEQIKMINQSLFFLILQRTFRNDLITFLLAMSIFATSFIGLSFLRQQNKSRLIASFQKLCVSFLSFGIGLACLYSREGTLYLKDLYLKLHKGNWDGLTYVGFWMLFLSVFIEVYAIIPLIGKKNDV